MSKSKRITAAMLLDAGACKDQVAVFRREWPCGVVPSEAACLRAAELGLDLGWFASAFLSATASAAYVQARAAAWAAYKKATATARAAYAQATALAEFEKARAPARAEFEKARATALWSAIEAGGLANVLGEAVQE